jgi:hypothetical protein
MGRSTSSVAANNGKSICSGAAGKTIPVNAPFGQMRFQFNGSGNLIGLGLPGAPSFRVFCERVGFHKWRVAQAFSVAFLSRSETVGAPSLRFWQGRVRCCLYDEISGGDQNRRCGPHRAHPSPRTRRVGHPLLLFVSAIQRPGHPPVCGLEGKGQMPLERETINDPRRFKDRR